MNQISKAPATMAAGTESETIRLRKIAIPPLEGVWEFEYESFFSQLPDVVKWYGLRIGKEVFYTHFHAEAIRSPEVTKQATYSTPIKLLQASKIMLLQSPDTDDRRVDDVTRDRELLQPGVKKFNLFVVINEVKLLNLRMVVYIDMVANTSEHLAVLDFRRG